ncbi:MAG TPA: hypothetical protein VMW08_00620 [Acidimicrobiales bacterium]|nr:hypothetical protein [Acidimicrobiales bacterium]
MADPRHPSQPPDAVADLEAMAAHYRKVNGLPPDAPIQINLGDTASKALGDLAAIEIAGWLDATCPHCHVGPEDECLADCPGDPDDQAE